jgi:DNA-binding transcriptional ArsR family regulator
VGQNARVDAAVMAGEGFELLVQAAALADPEWQQVFTGRTAFAQRLLADGPGGCDVAEVARIGRLGWLNLMPLLAESTAGYDVAQLVRLVGATTPARLHRLLLGGERTQLVELVGPALVDAAVAGQATARDRLREVLRSNDVVIGATDHVLDAPSAVLHDEVHDTLRRWQERPPYAGGGSASDAAGTARALLARLGPARYLERTVPGMTYRLAGADRVAVVVSPSVAPIVVVVDGVDRVLIAHPPVGDRPAPSGGTDRLVELARAAGDPTRGAILAALAEGQHTAVRLAETLGSPRTTLLHHLAILRAAGLLHIEVSPGSATVYRLRPEGLTELARLAEDLVTRR